MKKMHTKLKMTAAVAACGIVLAAWPAISQDVKLPQTVGWSAFDVGTGTYNEAVAQAAAIKKRYGTDIRIIPARNDISRMAPLRAGQVEFSAMGSGTLFIQEGVYEFGVESWGPQKINIVALNVFPAHVGFYVSEKSGIRTIADLKGKRVPQVRGAPSLSELVRGYLAFAGLTLDDVTIVEVPGFIANLNAFTAGQTDMGIATTLSPVPKRADASPQGPIYWPPFPHDDKEGWARMQKVLPYAQPIVTTSGTRVPKDPPLQGITYALPIIISYDQLDDELAYNMAKAIHETYPDYKDSMDSIKGFKLQPQSIEYPVPFHPGAIKYYKELGMWKEKHDAENAANVKRQAVLAEAWEAQKAKNLSGDVFAKDWAKSRAAALRKAGFEPIWE